MGFYFELYPQNDTGSFREGVFPKAYWILYLLVGFALTCMGSAAQSVIHDLIRLGSVWDRAILFFLSLSIPIYLLFGLRLLGMRKYVEVSSHNIEMGYQLFSKVIYRKIFARSNVLDVTLTNARPSANVAPQHHGDSQYFIRGHWKVGLKLRNGQSVILDRHTEREILEPLYERCRLTSF